ncbi:hypothetical protein CVT24_002549, partial [Panaeolus cyanescens]
MQQTRISTRTRIPSSRVRGDDYPLPLTDISTSLHTGPTTSDSPTIPPSSEAPTIPTSSPNAPSSPPVHDDTPALNADGSLKDASDIEWQHSASDTASRPPKRGAPSASENDQNAQESDTGSADAESFGSSDGISKKKKKKRLYKKRRRDLKANSVDHDVDEDGMHKDVQVQPIDISDDEGDVKPLNASNPIADIQHFFTDAPRENNKPRKFCNPCG